MTKRKIENEYDHCTRCDALGYRDNSCHLCAGTGFVSLPQNEEADHE